MKTPNTITDEQWRDIQERAEKASPPMFSAEAIAKRKKSSKQKQNADKS